jgi:hypothetical protein
VEGCTYTSVLPPDRGHRSNLLTVHATQHHQSGSVRSEQSSELIRGQVHVQTLSEKVGVSPHQVGFLNAPDIGMVDLLVILVLLCGGVE